MRFVGANPDAAIAWIDHLPGTLNVFSGSDPAAWRRGIPQYGSVRQRDVYPGIGVIYHGHRRELVYDLVVAPDADPSRIALAFDDAAGLTLDRNGDLIILIGDASLRQLAPIAYQELDGRRQPVRSRFALDGAGHVTFEVGAYDRARPLVIDPTRVYATFAGEAITFTYYIYFVQGGSGTWTIDSF